VYPQDMLSSPPQDLKAQFTFTAPEAPRSIAAQPPVPRPAPAGHPPVEAKTPEPAAVVEASRTESAPSARAAAPASAPVAAAAGRQPMPARGDSFTELISKKELTLPVLLISLLIAFGLGAFHALSPGHGKTIVAAYLVGSRGTAKHAVFLGAVVTMT